MFVAWINMWKDWLSENIIQEVTLFSCTLIRTSFKNIKMILDVLESFAV